MSDKRLAEHCRSYKEASRERDAAKVAILAELDRRGVQVGTKVDEVERYGVRLRKKSRKFRHYIPAKVREHLPRARWPDVIVEVVSVQTLDAFVEQGLLSEVDRKDCLDRTDESEPFITVDLLA